MQYKIKHQNKEYLNSANTEITKPVKIINTNQQCLHACVFVNHL